MGGGGDRCYDPWLIQPGKISPLLMKAPRTHPAAGQARRQEGGAARAEPPLSEKGQKRVRSRGMLMVVVAQEKWRVL